MSHSPMSRAADESADADESAMSSSEKLAYVMEIRDIFGDDAAESVAAQLGVFLPGLVPAASVPGYHPDGCRPD